MKTEIESIPEITIEEFADLHGLIMEIKERRCAVNDPDRYYARFKKCEIKDGAILIGAYGNGATHEEAIRNYRNRINLETLVFNAYGAERKEIEVPRLKPSLID